MTTIRELLGDSAMCLSQPPLNNQKAVYAIKLSSITKRRDTPVVPQGRFAGVMSGLGNVISDAVSSAITNSFFVGMESGAVCYISDNVTQFFFNPDTISVTGTIEPGSLLFSVSLNEGIIQSANFEITTSTINNTFAGDIVRFIRDFKATDKVHTDNLSAHFAKVRVSQLTQNPAKPYEVSTLKSFDTLISYDENHIYLNNAGISVEYSKINMMHAFEDRYMLITNNSETFLIYEIFIGDNADEKPIEFNFIASGSETCERKITIPFPENILRVKEFVTGCKFNEFCALFADGKIYMPAEEGLKETGLFAHENTIYAKLLDGTITKYPDKSPVIDMLSNIPYRCDAIFMKLDEPQPAVTKDSIISVYVKDSGIEIGSELKEYTKMQNYKCSENKYCCCISYTYNGIDESMIIANPLGIYISQIREKISTEDKIREYTINQLYSYYYKNSTDNFVAATFSEIFKTDKMLNREMKLDDLLDILETSDDAVLRSAFQSMLSSFKSVDDLQETLIHKLTLLEAQRVKIQKLLGEWALIYPHYAANMQVKWLKTIFGPYASEGLLKQEYWKCVNCFKRILASANSSIQGRLNDVAQCTRHINSALPDEVKRMNVANELRLSPKSHTRMLKTGTDTLMAVTSGVALANIVAKSFSATSLMSATMSIKMLVDSYAKDVEMRKNVKAFGEQALQWWQILTKELSIHILELSHGYNEYNQQCLKRDTELFKKIPEQDVPKVKNRIVQALKGNIMQNVDDRYQEIDAMLNVRISNILEDINETFSDNKLTLDEFRNNLYI